jgi:nucleoside-diphosphate-sugar epimerase
MEKGLRPLGIQPPLHRRRLDFFRKSFTLSADRAREAFGFDPKIDFAEGARRTAEYYEKMGFLN